MNLSEVKSADCHYLPCKIKTSGDAPVSTYFNPLIEEVGENKQCSFRGRPLIGKEIDIPADYVGVVLENNTNTELCATKQFEKFIYWNWDKIPSNDDAIIKMMEWIDIAKAIHQN